MFEFLWEYRQQREVNEASAKAREAARSSSESRLDIDELQRRIDTMGLLLMAMWSIIEEKTQVTEQELAARVRDLDMIDGRSDGRMPRMVTECRDCGRKMNLRHRTCMYCGGESLQQSPFAGM
jgi:hypothetical protein